MHARLRQLVWLRRCGGTICAAAHYFRHDRAPERAEVAFAVADALRGQGVGTKLLERLASVAREHGIRVFTAQVLGENRPMLDVFFQSGYESSVERDGGVAYVTLAIDATPAVEARSADRNEQAAAASMKLLFEPHSIAVIGASRNASHIGGAIFRNLWKTGFSGALYPVHPEAVEIDGVKAYRAIADVPVAVDLAVIAVPAAHVAKVVDRCLAKGVRALVVISAGFGEVGDDGRALKGFLPRAASVSNPVDMLASASADHFAKAIALLQADENVDSILAIFVPPLVTNPWDAAGEPELQPVQLHLAIMPLGHAKRGVEVTG